MLNGTLIHGLNTCNVTLSVLFLRGSNHEYVMYKQRTEVMIGDTYTSSIH